MWALQAQDLFYHRMPAGYVRSTSKTTFTSFQCFIKSQLQKLY